MNKKILIMLFSIFAIVSVYAQEIPEISTDEVITLLQSRRFILFGLQDCPYFRNVFRFIGANGIGEQFFYIDVQDAHSKRFLEKVSGKTRVPYLIDQEKQVQMPESLDIINYLNQELLQGALDQDQINSYGCYFNSLPDHPCVKEFTTLLENSDKPVVVLVSATWCPPCREYKPEFHQIALDLQDICTCLTFDFQKDEAIAAYLKIQYLPFVVCFYKGQRYELKDRSKQGIVELIKTITELA